MNLKADIMMENAITFDTLAFAKKLESSGIQSKQAEAVAEAIKDVFDENMNPHLFTKKDGKMLENKFEHKFEALENKFDAKLSGLKSELIMWMVGLLFAQSAIILSIIKFMH